MDKKYQIFVSSTYTDLTEERQAVSRAILDLDQIPAGMEMFPAADVEQLTYIKKVIDECDYYILIIGSRYGSLDSNGTSYTELEYDYAVTAGKVILAFIHADVDAVPFGKTDKDDGRRLKLEAFMAKVSTGRMIQKWSNPLDLKAKAIVSLTKAFAEAPRTGWIRADKVPTNSELINAIGYREENDRLKVELETLRASALLCYDDAADLSASITIGYRFTGRIVGQRDQQKMTFADVLKIIAFVMLSPATLGQIRHVMEKGLEDRFGANHVSSVSENDIRDALVHLIATGHVRMQNPVGKEGAEFELTPLGVKTWQEITYIRKSGSEV